MVPDLSTTLGPLVLRTPIVVASGVFGFGNEYPDLEGFDFEGVGAITLKGVTLEPSEGNRPPRIAEVASGLVNSIGLQNPGVDALVEKILPSLPELPCKIIANISGSAVEEYEQVAQRLAATDRLDAIEVNVSCPNVKRGGMLFGCDPKMTEEVTRVVKRQTKLPVIVKLTPNVADIRPTATAAMDGGADALSLINTLRALVIDAELRRPLLGATFGGLSGPAIKPVALYHVYQAYSVARERGIAILGMGGAATATDVVEFMLAGASAVGIGSPLFWDHRICAKAAAGLRDWMVAHKTASVRELVGGMRV